MCDFTPDIPKLAPAPPPPAPANTPKLSTALNKNGLGINADGTPIRKKTGLSSLRIDRQEGSGLNIPTEV